MPLEKKNEWVSRQKKMGRGKKALKKENEKKSNAPERRKSTYSIRTFLSPPHLFKKKKKTDHLSMALLSGMRGSVPCTQNALHWPKISGEENNQGSGQHSTNHATAASGCQLQQQEGLCKGGQSLINMVRPTGQSRQSATKGQGQP